jgi:hypothetical protein
MQNTGSIALSSKELWPPKINFIHCSKIAILGTPIVQANYICPNLGT